MGFISVFNAQGELVWEGRAREFVGQPEDLWPLMPAYDETGDHFMIGDAVWEVQADGSMEPVPIRFPPGENFLARVACNMDRLIDPVHRYQLWYGCGMPNALIALFSMDQNNLPVGLRVKGGVPVLDWLRGRAFFVNDNDIAIVHYADRGASLRPAEVDLQGVWRAYTAQGAFCSQTSPCEGMQVCVPDSDTSPVGHCMDNVRNPAVQYCAGLGGLSCDPGYDCRLSNPTNPGSLGYCEGSPALDFARKGLTCSESSECPEGHLCQRDRCVPDSCLFDSDCAQGQVCGSIPWLGRVCMQPGPLGEGSFCTLSSDCASGACVLEREPEGAAPGQAPEDLSNIAGFCQVPCWQDANCGAGSQCVGSHRAWETPGYHFPHCQAVELLECDCSELTFCTGGRCLALGSGDGDSCQCQVGFAFPVERCAAGDPSCEQHTCLEPAENFGSDPAWPDCGLTCKRNEDCPWNVDCLNGQCLHGVEMLSPCRNGTGCMDHQSCAIVDGAPRWSYRGDSDLRCMDMDGCRDTNDCGPGQICIGVCTTNCSQNSDCPGDQYCVTNFDAHGGDPNARACMNIVCDCEGDAEETGICNYQTAMCN